MRSERAPPLTNEHLIRAFRRATCSLDNAPQRWEKRAEKGLNDAQLAKALVYEMGAMGGQCDESGWLEYQGEGLKIWASTGYISRHNEPPTLQGAATMRLAREIYGIRDADDQQLGLFG